MILSLMSLLSVMFWAVSCTARTGNGGGNEWVYPDKESGWRSELYPEDWIPGYRDKAGRFLHDFSYAGYHSGLDRIPTPDMNVTDVTKEPYLADNTGRNDATAAIQKAIDAVSSKGGGVVYLPAGHYTVSLPEGRGNVLTITHDNVVIRGAGHDRTFITNTTTEMRSRTIVAFSGNASWDSPQGAEVPVSKDVLLPSFVIPVDAAGTFAPGDMIIIKSDVTDAFREEFKVGNDWGNLKKGPHFLRKVVAVDASSGTIEIDVPTRYRLLVRDNARVYKVKMQLQECGIEHLAIANVQHPATTGWGEEDYRDSNNGSYHVHGSQAVKFSNAENCWARKVYTFRPEGNEEHIHILSNGIKMTDSRFITVQECNVQRSQYEGGGGNGYLYTFAGNECLALDCHAEHGRHNYDLQSMHCSGNVLLRCHSKDPKLASDFHMHLSMANLFDSFVADGDYIDASFRPYGSAGAMHLYTTTESVIWNVTGVKARGNSPLVDSRQLGNGYVIGTKGVVDRVETQPVSGSKGGKQYDTAPEDWVEGVGMGGTLNPQSLYEDQLKLRKERND